MIQDEILYWCCWGKLELQRLHDADEDKCIPLSICMLYYYRETNELLWRVTATIAFDFWEVTHMKVWIRRSWAWDTDLQIPGAAPLRCLTTSVDEFQLCDFSIPTWVVVNQIKDRINNKVFNEKTRVTEHISPVRFAEKTSWNIVPADSLWEKNIVPTKNNKLKNTDYKARE